MGVAIRNGESSMSDSARDFLERGPQSFTTPKNLSVPFAAPSLTYNALHQGSHMQDQPSRRDFLAAAGLAVGASTLQQSGRANRLLLKGGCVVSLDPAVGDFERADVLIEGTRIAAVRPNVTAEATTIDATGMIVMPGLIDTHRHM